MKIAIIGDIHANLPAMLAVLADAEKRGAESIYNVGDVIGYGPSPDETVELLQSRNIRGIIGNYDAKAIAIGENATDGPKSPQKRFAFKWAFENLSPASRDYLKSLPASLRLTIEGKNILLVHGSIESDSEYVDDTTPVTRLKELAKLSQADIVISGHSHRPAIRRTGGVIFANTGSVGRSDDGDPSACYLICDITQGKIGLKHFRVEYDVQLAAKQIRDKNLPEEFAQMILQGKNLDAISQSSKVEKSKPTAQANDETDFAKLHASAGVLAAKCRYEMAHARQVQKLSLSIFDQLQSLHNLPAQCRELLSCAAILHDIGWIEGRKGHHKTSMRLIMQSPILPLSDADRLIVANAARYHRKSLPSATHENYVAMNIRSRRIARILGGIIRLADGLDVSHCDHVDGVKISISQTRISITCTGPWQAEAEKDRAKEKSDLLSHEFNLPIIIKASVS